MESMEWVSSLEQPMVMEINASINIRGRNHSNLADIPEGQQNRGLPNFNHLIDKVKVKDTYVSKL